MDFFNLSPIILLIFLLLTLLQSCTIATKKASNHFPCIIILFPTLFSFLIQRHFFFSCSLTLFIWGRILTVRVLPHWTINAQQRHIMICWVQRWEGEQDFKPLFEFAQFQSHNFVFLNQSLQQKDSGRSDFVLLQQKHQWICCHA